MDNTLDAKKEQVMKMLNNEVSKYTKDGSSLPQAITLTCKKLGLNPYNIVSKYFPEIKPDDLNAYKDIKTDEGSFVTLKGDSSQSQYEVININNKDAIVLRNTDNNQEITASEDEITPVITENKMDKLNEAQYSVSINGLETTDAAALSQMLSSAAQAEQSNGAVTDPMSINPEPMDMTTGMPMDMGAELPAPSLDMPMDSTMPEETLPAEDSVEDVPAIEDDIEFDEELPEGEPISLATDANAYANPEIDTAVVPTDSLEDFGYEKVEEPSEDEEATPVESPEELEPANDFGGESIEDMSMDDMMDDGMYEGFDYDALIKEALEAAGLNESEETIPASDDVEDDGSMNGSQEDYAEEITEGKKECCPKCGKEECVCEEDESFDDEIAEALRLAGVELNEAKSSNGKLKRLIYKLNGLLKFMKTIDVSDNEILDDQINGLWNDICYTMEDIKEALKSRKLNEADEEKYRRVKKNVDKNFHIYDPAHDEADDGQDYDDDAIEMSVEYIANRDGLPLHVAARKYAKEYNISYEVVCRAIERDGSGPENPEPGYYDLDNYDDSDYEKEEEIDEGNEEINAGDNINLDTNESFDDEIAEALRLAGVQLNEATKKLIGGFGTTSPYTYGQSYDFNANKSDILKTLKNIANRAKDLKMTGDSSDKDKRYSFEFDEDDDKIWDEQVEPLLKEAEKGSRNLISIYKNLSKIFKENMRNSFVWHSMIHYLGFHEQWKPNWVDEKDWGKLADSCAAAAVLAKGSEFYSKNGQRMGVYLSKKDLIKKMQNDPKVYIPEEKEDGDDKKIYNSLRYMLKTYSDANKDTIFDVYSNFVNKDIEYLEDVLYYGDDGEFDDEISEALRLAGVELNEAEATEPTPVDDKTLYRNKQAKTAEKQEPEYHEVDTTPFSKESSEGFKMTMEAAVNKDKVKKIYETAKSMYAKKDFNEWMTLDRRYVTKLIKEGISYDKANKILTSAKKGK